MTHDPTPPTASTDSRAARPPLIARLGLSAVVFLLVFMIGEAILRAAAHRANAGVLASAFTQIEAPSDDPQARLINIIRLTENERIIYELQANLEDRYFRETRVNTDELGFRVSPPVPTDSRPLVTVMGIGDSIMFGHGVEDDETYLHVLQELLQEEYPSRRWRVINSGVPGYNTAMEVETLRTKGLALEPDVVILNIVGNDYAPPYFVRNEENVWALRSFVADYVRDRLAAGSEGSEDGEGAIQRGRAWFERDEQDQQVVPDRYRDVFGKEAYARALDDLKQMAEEHGFGVLAFTTYEYELTFEMVEQAKQRGFRHSTLMPTLEAWMLEHMDTEWTPKSYSHSPLVVSPTNSHPSAKQNVMAARRLVADMKTFGLLDDVLADE